MNVLTASHQGTSAQLRRSRCQNGLGDLREGLDMSRTSVVEVATPPLGRSGEGQMGWSAPKTIQSFQMGGHGVVGGFQVCWKCGWLCGVSPFVCRMAATCTGLWAWETVCKFGEKPSPGVANVATQWRCTSSLVGTRAPGMLVGCSVDWLRLASHGGDRGFERRRWGVSLCRSVSQHNTNPRTCDAHRPQHISYTITLSTLKKQTHKLHMSQVSSGISFHQTRALQHLLQQMTAVFNRSCSRPLDA